MPDGPLTDGELAAVISTCAGVQVAPESLSAQPAPTFADLGVDSLGVLGVVAELERRIGQSLGPDAESAQSPRELTSLVNATCSREE